MSAQKFLVLVSNSRDEWYVGPFISYAAAQAYRPQEGTQVVRIDAR